MQLKNAFVILLIGAISSACKGTPISEATTQLASVSADTIGGRSRRLDFHLSIIDPKIKFTGVYLSSVHAKHGEGQVLRPRPYSPAKSTNFTIDSGVFLWHSGGRNWGVNRLIPGRSVRGMAGGGRVVNLNVRHDNGNLCRFSENDPNPDYQCDFSLCKDIDIDDYRVTWDPPASRKECSPVQLKVHLMV